MYKIRFLFGLWCCILFVCCTNLDEIYNRLDHLDKEVSDIQQAVDALQKAYDDGKVIKSITPIDADNSGWSIVFSDNSIIRLMNGQDGKDGQNGMNGRDGLTPYLFVDQDGYWCLSYDEGENFTRMMDSEGNYVKANGDKGDKGEIGDKGDEGVSVRVIVNNEGYYIFELYNASNPTKVIDTIITPYNINPANLISGIAVDDVTHIITLTMQNGSAYTFNKVYNTPTSVAILVNRVLIGNGSTQSFEFRVNPSNAIFNYDVTSADCEIELDIVGNACTRADGYVTLPTNYKLSKVEQVYTSAGKLKSGQYRAYITDLNISKMYDDLASLVLTLKNGNGETIQLSSSAFEIKYSSNLITEFKFLKSDNTSVLEDVEATIDGANITLNTPFIFDRTNLVASYKTNGKRLFVNDVEQTSGVSINNFSSPLKYTVISEDGEKKDYTVTVNISGLPVVYINTKDNVAITSKDDWYKKTSIKIIKEDGTIDYSDNSLQIKGRGNSTWTYPKKPYALKLNSKHEILGMPQHKRWVLLANWMDRTLLRNDVTFQIAKQTCMSWTPRGKFVEVVLNGVHIGNYYLCEQIKIDANRVNVAEMTTIDIAGDEVTGGYLMELDVYYDEVNKFKSATKNLPYMFKEPDEETLQQEQLTYFQDYINEMEAKMYADDWLTTRDYATYMDLNTFVDWWFVYELAKNGEPNHPKSCYMHKDRLGVLKAGPVWDFDWGIYTPGTTFSIDNAIYYGRLFQDPVFKSLVKTRWTALKPQFTAIETYIRSVAAKTKVSNEINIRLWPISSSINGDESMGFDDCIDRMVDAYKGKLNWLDVQISAW